MLLPPELIDHIFSFLRNDTSALKACSKAHPFYSTLAERYLYTDIVVDPHAVSDLHKQFSEKSRLLDYPRTLELRSGFGPQPVISLLIMPMISRMANLVSLKLINLFDQSKEFISMFTICLQQSSFEQLYLAFLYEFPFSILDNGKNIKKLTLSDCSALEEPMSSSPISRDAHTFR